MPKFDLDFTCDCGPDVVLAQMRGADADWWRKHLAKNPAPVTHCGACGASVQLAEDGDAFTQVNVSTPKITSLSGSVSGPIAGGTVVRINGQRFSHTTPSVFFNGVPAAFVSVMNDVAMDVSTPAGTIALLGTVVSGEFGVGETVTGASSLANARIASLAPMRVTNLTGEFTDGELLQGADSGAQMSLATPSMDGLVDITVQNVFGRRQGADTLENAFEYTV